MIERITFRRDDGDRMAACEVMQVRLRGGEFNFAITGDWVAHRCWPETREEHGHKLRRAVHVMAREFEEMALVELRRMGHLV